MAEKWQIKYLSALPAVDAAVTFYQQQSTALEYPHALLVQAAQTAVAQLRQKILQAKTEKELEQLRLTIDAVAGQMKVWLDSLRQPSLRRVINATGTVLHTNLGRAPLAAAAQKAMQEAAGYCNLEMKLQEGVRGSRHEHLEKLLCELTGAEAACVVNNNAAAVLVALNTLACGRKAIVSRGELVEIGGSFRIPEVMKAGGVQLVEVGTSNKTHFADYQNAIDEETALLLKVHTSNYKIIGFTASVSLPELIKLGQERGLPVMKDIGSGLLVDLTPFGLPKEPLVQECIAAGVDILTMSGDKLLGGPQAGIILGKRKYVEAIKRNQLLRALRPDKITLAALEATLRIYLTSNPLGEVPVLAMLSMSTAVLKKRAFSLAQAIERRAAGILTVEVREDFSYVGGGAMPTAKLPTYVVAVRHQRLALTEWAEKLRTATPALVGRIKDDWLLLDPRTIDEAEEEEVVQCLT
ncbi:MAG: L-seryl-tRNA(Sec) selenium transferase [Firmicutes bacterium]|nr:L-seryl-tRNA(Sec) selenium transferase [Bacillota bacterium]